jgi:hypothetical protein
MADNTSKPSETKAPEPAAVAPETDTAWTVMVYLAGDNNLADECVFALTEMKAAMIDTRVTVVAQFDPTARRVRTRRFVLNKSLHEGKNGNNPDRTALAALGGQAWNNRKSILDDAIVGLPAGTKPFPDKSGKDGGRLVNPVGAAGVAAVAVVPAPAPADEFDTDSGDPKLLFDFINWTVEQHPADHYMIILSGHGSGVLDQEFLRDESSKGTLTIKELGEVFKAVKKELKDKEGNQLVIDVLGFDSCVMGMAEVCYELADTVKYMVSSESFGPQTGWPYGRIIDRLSTSLKNTNGKTSAKELALFAVDEHVDFYLEYAEANGLSVDISVMDVEKIPLLVEDVYKLAAVLREALTAGEKRKMKAGFSEFLDQIVLAHWEAQSYNGELYVDLRDFCERLQARYRPDLVKPVPAGDPAEEEVNAEIERRKNVFKACTDVINRIKNELVIQSCFMGVVYQFSNGVSVYLPWAEVAPDYNEAELRFIKASGWRDFLEQYVRVTRREPRGWTPLTTEAPFIRLDTKVRRTVTDQKGPVDVITRSMRNPPIEIFQDGLSDCTLARLGIKKP